jgi:hypothetical protein
MGNLMRKGTTSLENVPKQTKPILMLKDLKLTQTHQKIKMTAWRVRVSVSTMKEKAYKIQIPSSETPYTHWKKDMTGAQRQAWSGRRRPNKHAGHHFIYTLSGVHYKIRNIEDRVKDVWDTVK